MHINKASKYLKRDTFKLEAWQELIDEEIIKDYAACSSFFLITI